MSVAHVGISVSNIEQSIDWYCRNFGFEEQKRFKKPEIEIAGVVLAKNDTSLELLEPFHPIARQNEGVNHLTSLLQRTGLNHIAIEVDDLKKVYDSLKAQNMRLITKIISGRYFFCLDLDGTPIEVKQK